jgi:hypothetical protein
MIEVTLLAFAANTYLRRKFSGQLSADSYQPSADSGQE